MFVARKNELKSLRNTLKSDRAEFVAVYGRRRVGKTMLVREAYADRLVFQHAGLASGGMKEQLAAFGVSLRGAGMHDAPTPKSWLEAFELLERLIDSAGKGKKVVFLDELSWMDTPRSGFMMALEFFWNSWASARNDVVLATCASATSWMLSKVIHNKGGLYNRLTLKINLQPFTLAECEMMTQAMGVRLNRHQIMEGYMILGGVPHYWAQLDRSKSLAQNIDALFFAKTPVLENEFDYLYASIFRNPEDYLHIVSALGKRRAGMGRGEIAKTAHVADSGKLTRMLGELESCGFIRRYSQFANKERGALYQLIDNFTLFYYKFIEKGVTDEHFWEHQTNTPARNAWCGLAFERVCLEHVPQIKHALGISGVLTETHTWSCAADPEKGLTGSQIDLLIVRRDQVINVCEMKYSASRFTITKAGDQAIRDKLSDFVTATRTRYAMHTTYVTPYGLADNAYAGNVQSQVVADDLFAF